MQLYTSINLINLIVSNIWQVCDNFAVFLDFSLFVLWVISASVFLFYCIGLFLFFLSGFIVMCVFSLLFVYGPTVV